MNSPYKSYLKEEFIKWYSNRVKGAIKESPDNIEVAVAAVNPDIRFSVLNHYKQNGA